MSRSRTPKPIRPDARDIICQALKRIETIDGKGASEHFHLLSATDAVVRGFAAEGIDIEALVDDIINRQTVTFTGGGS